MFGILLFPSGAPPTPRWTFVAWVAGVAMTIQVAAVAMSPGPITDFEDADAAGGEH